ncbi:MAG TPA: hypothetical protein VN688_33410 [Gemmataceae bacterium]|nr:hypothetical protein [Gemmataceae bacterium]
MNAIRFVFTAFSNLATSLNALAGVVDIATGRLRQQLALDAPEVIEHQADTTAEDSTSAKPARKRSA